MCLRIEFTLNANRTHLDRGSDTPVSTPFYKNVKALLPHPREPSLPSLRLASPLILTQRHPKLGCGRFFFSFLPDTHIPHLLPTSPPSLPLTATRQPTPPTPKTDPKKAKIRQKRSKKASSPSKSKKREGLEEAEEGGGWRVSGV